MNDLVERLETSKIRELKQQLKINCQEALKEFTRYDLEIEDLKTDLDTYMRIANDVTSRERKLVEFTLKYVDGSPDITISADDLINEFNKTLDKDNKV